ncbi:MAG: bifunctional metallophosphatase/5'-nucleotidase [Candidatus Marinimicrobia bacterium]|nr:bifunctional metallophosphatase/5'-nucleotidase [Candidatus Neomarinimicrobiota bacterium]
MHKRVSGYLILIFGLQLLLSSCSEPAEEKENGSVQLTVLYTNDEHGWIEETASADGAAKLMGVWQEKEGYDPDDPSYLILSGGDNWTGPAISTWFQGESTLEVMNAMHYDATAIGNHEFDFTIDGLKQLIDLADFPYLSANIRLKGTDSIPDFVKPYVILDIEGVNVGIIGLTTLSASYSTFPTYVEDLDFIDYADALQDYVPELWEAGADLILCVAHICYGEAVGLVDVAQDLGVSMIGGGHCNELEAEVFNESVAVVEGGWRMASYARVDLYYDAEQAEVTVIEVQTSANSGGSPDQNVTDIVSIWQQATQAALGEVVGYASADIAQWSTELRNLVTDSWLVAFPTADIAVTNAGGIRQAIAAGDITKGDIVGVLPFNNNILELKLTGAEVIDCIGSNLILAGMTTVNGYKHADGTPLEMDSVYSVLTTDYLYYQETLNFNLFDPSPYFTGLNYHQPTVDYIVSLNTSASDPLNNYLDNSARR